MREAATLSQGRTRPPGGQCRGSDRCLDDLLEFHDAGDGLWPSIYKDGDHLPEILGYVTLLTDDFGDAMVLLASVPPEPEDPWTSRELLTLLELAWGWNFAKLGADPDGSLETMLELELRTTDTESLFLGAYSVGQAADDVAGLQHP